MPGTRGGGLKAAEVNKARWGKDFYRMIGSLGGVAGRGQNKGFAANRELAKTAGAKGGAISRRNYK